MVALGMDGLLLDGGDKGLTIRSGTAATLSGPSSEESQRWQRSRGCVSLLRPGLEAECPFPRLPEQCSAVLTLSFGVGSEARRLRCENRLWRGPGCRSPME